MTTWNRVAGDTGDVLDAFLEGITDLSLATSVVGHVWHGTETPVTVTGSIVSAPLRQVRLNIGTFLGSAVPRTYKLEFQVEFPAGPVTWPEGPPDEIRVRAQGA